MTIDEHKNILEYLRDLYEITDKQTRYINALELKIRLLEKTMIRQNELPYIRHLDYFI